MSIVTRSPAGTYIGRWILAVHKHAFATVAVAALLTVASLAYVFTSLGINTSTTDMISPEVPFRQHSIDFDRAFPRLDDNIVVVIDGPTREAADIAANDLARALALRPDRFHTIQRPGAEQFFRHNGLLFLDIDEISDLVDRLAGAEPLLAALAGDPSLRGLIEILDLALAEDDIAGAGELARAIDQMAIVATAMRDGRPLNLSWVRLLGETDAQDGETSAAANREFVLLQPELDHGSLKPAAAALEIIRATAGELGIDNASGLRLRITGSPAIEQEELESVELGGKMAGYLSLALVTLLLFLALKTVRLVAITVTTLLMGLSWTSAIATLTVGELNLISVAFAVLFIGLGVDFSIHFSLRYLETDPDDRDGPEANLAAGRSVGGALTLSAACAAAGFFAFLPTSYDGLAELGLIAGIGMFVALAANLTILPAFLTLLPPRNKLTAGSAITRAFAAFLQRRARAILFVACIAALASLVLLPSMKFDFNPINLRNPNDESVATFLDLASDPGSSAYTIDLLVPDIAAIGEISATLSALPEVGDVISVASFVPEGQDEKLAIVDELAFILTGALVPGAPPASASPSEKADLLAAFQQRLGDRALQADRLGQASDRLATALASLAALHEGRLTDRQIDELEERFVAYVPHMLGRLDAILFAAPVELENLPAEIVDQWVSQDGRARLLIQPAAGITSNEDLQIFADAVVAVAPRATGMPVIVTEAGRVILGAFVMATSIAFGAILIILFALLRRPRDVVLVLLPLIFAAALTIATSSVIGLAFNFANIIVLPLLLGLGIASAIHFVIRWRDAGRDLAVIGSSTPRAVLFSAMTTVAAFGSLAVSGHLGMRSMGLLLAIALAATLISTLIVLPGLMTVLGGRAKPSDPGKTETPQ